MKKIHPEVTQLLAEIEAYRARAGIDRTEFGLRSVHDGNFISRLEHGRNPRFETIDRIRAFMDKNTKAVRK
jgi:predicted transcriptional regulator